jgi:hypothetical protein
MARHFIISLILLFFVAGCSSATDADTGTTNKNCYQLRDTTTFGELGSWYQVAMAYDRVNKLECFTIDTTGMSQKLMPDLVFNIGHNQYRSTGKCRYDISPDYRLLYNYNCNGALTRDTLTYEIAHPDRDYLVLILPADTVAWKDSRPLSVLYLRAH